MVLSEPVQLHHITPHRTSTSLVLTNQTSHFCRVDRSVCWSVRNCNVWRLLMWYNIHSDWKISRPNIVFRTNILLKLKVLISPKIWLVYIILVKREVGKIMDFPTFWDMFFIASFSRWVCQSFREIEGYHACFTTKNSVKTGHLSNFQDSYCNCGITYKRGFDLSLLQIAQLSWDKAKSTSKGFWVNLQSVALWNN